jgi:arginase
MLNQTPTLIGFRYDASSSFLRGPAQAPGVIRAALNSTASNRWSEALIDLSLPQSLADVGDIALPEAAVSRDLITQATAGLISKNGRPIALGGDHSVTYPILRAIGPQYPQLTILHFDAHPDLYDDFNGDRYSHACPFARIMEDRLATRLVQVGIRTMSAAQRIQVERYGVEVIDMRAWERGVRPKVSGPVYLSVDLDGFDPAFAPGVSHPESGGLSARAVLSISQQLPGPIIGADVVELNPLRDVNGLTAMLAAKLVKEIASRMLETDSNQ